MSQAEMVIAPVAQPRGLRYLFGTWSGRLIVVNSIVFVLMVWASQSLMVPNSEVLLNFGAKDPVLIAQGEFWRFFTPIFVHIGIIHFAFNTMGLYYIGYQLESLLGPRWFLTIYLLSGTIGNIASGVFNTSLSAGASGSLFGLLGCGFLVERIVGKRIENVTGRRPVRKVYASMVVTNLVFGILIPGIDNGAHIGGMITGIILTSIMLSVRPNQLRPPNRFAAIAMSSFLALFTLGGGVLASSKKYVSLRFQAAIENSKGDEERFARISQALRLTPDDPKLLVARARVLIIHGEMENAIEDIEAASKQPTGTSQVSDMLNEIEALGFQKEAETLRRYLPQTQPI